MRVTARIEKEKILAEANAKAEKTESEARKKAKRINNKQTRAFIIDAILLALLVGIIVNQATFLLPEGTISALLIILISLLCIVLVFIFQTRE